MRTPTLERTLVCAALALTTLGCNGAPDDSAAGNTPDCASFLDETGVPVVTIRVVNDTSDTIVLEDFACASRFPIGLEGPSGVMATQLNATLPNCQFLQKYAYYGGTGSCYPPDLHVINPGGHWNTSWNGLEFHDVEMPAACLVDPGADPTSSTTCPQGRAAPPGSYVARAKASKSAYCDPTGTCECPDGGPCARRGTASSPSLFTETHFDLPTSMVTLTFQ